MAIVGRRSRLLEISRARVCISPALQSPSPKLETTRSQALRTPLHINYHIRQFRHPDSRDPKESILYDRRCEIYWQGSLAIFAGTDTQGDVHRFSPNKS